MTYEPGIDIVVVNYHTPLDLRDCLNSIRDHEPRCPYTVTVVNVEAGENDTAMAWDVLEGEGWHRRTDFRVIDTISNVGYARACNEASRLGRRDTILFLNADTALKTPVLDECRNALHSDSTWAILGPCQVDQRNRVVHAGIFGTLDNPRWRGNFHGPMRDEYTDVRDDAVTVVGSVYFVKRAVWDEMTNSKEYQGVVSRWFNQHNHDSLVEVKAFGAFLPTQHYYEETFCSYHAQHLGYKVVYYGPAVVMHKWHASSPQGKEGGDRHWKSSQRFFKFACESMGIPHDIRG